MKDMFYTIDKLRNRIHELDNYRYRDIIELEYFNTKLNEDKDIAPVIPQEFDRTIKLGETWKGRDLYLWMQNVVNVPASWKGKSIVGIFDFGETGAGNNSGFESLFYLNNKPYQGVDSNHKEVFFPEGIAGTDLELLFRLSLYELIVLFLFNSFNLLYKSSSLATSCIVTLLYISFIEGSTLLETIGSSIWLLLDAVSKSNLSSSITSSFTNLSSTANELNISSFKAV